MRKKALTYAGHVLGTAAVTAYLSQSLGFGSFPERLSLLFALAIGPLAALGVVRFTYELSTDRPGQVRSARTLLITAFTLLTLMVSIQQMGVHRFHQTPVPPTLSPAEARYVFGQLSSVQLGADVAFDIFYCLGIICLALSLWKQTGFGRLLPATGIALGMLLLAANLAAFPQTPHSAGLIDVGPATGVWWLALIVARVRIKRRALVTA